MALFNKKKTEESGKKASDQKEDYTWVLLKPRITEKATVLSGENIYVFDVAPRANKIQIKKAIEMQYKVKPIKVNIVAQKARKVMKRGRKVHQKGSKKAMVFLKKGESIELA